MRNITLQLAAVALAAVPVLSVGHATEEVSLNSEELLAPYYAKLAKSVELPVAPANVPLAPDRTITRLAFGSCNHQMRPQNFWSQIAGTNPDLFLFIGDNNYGDQMWGGDAALTTLRQAYAVQAETPELAEFRSQVPMMITWDDHDYGLNDGGASFAYRQWAETIFETFWGSSEEVRSRPGVYESRMFGEPEQVTQVIVLDTRYFRSDLATMPYQMERPPLGYYAPSADPDKTMLGQEQWSWLEQELARPADLRIIASSIQVLTDAHNYESWENLPLERDRLFETLSKREDSGLLLLSGDRHAGGIYSDIPPAGGGEQFWELTSSSLNYSFSDTGWNTQREPDPKRLTDFISEENFGLVEIDWDTKAFTLSMRGSAGEVRVSQTVSW